MSTHSSPTLADLLELFSEETLGVLAAKNGLDIPVRSITLPDTGAGLGACPDSLHLGLATEPGGGTLGRTVDACEAVGAAGLVIRRSACSPDMKDTLRSRDLVTLHIDDQISWPALFSGLTTTLAGLHEVSNSIASDLASGDLFGLVNSIAGALGAATVIEDVSRQVIAYSTLPGQVIDDIREQGILGRHVPNFPGNDATYQAMWRSPCALRVVSGYPGHRPRLCVAVRVGPEPIGSIWVVEGDTALQEDALAILDAAAPVVAIHLMRFRTGFGVADREQARRLLALLDGEGDASALRHLGFDPRGHFGVIVYALAADVAGAAAERVAGIAQFDHEPGLHVRGARRDDFMFTMVSDTKPLPGRRLRALAEAATHRAETAASVRLRAAVSPADADVRAIARAAHNCVHALRISATRTPASEVVSCDDFAASLYLMRMKEGCFAGPSKHAELLSEIEAYDAKHGSFYLDTLRANLDANGDLTKASRKLNIHRNTLRYRKERLISLFNIDLNDPDERLVLGLQIRLRDL